MEENRTNQQELAEKSVKHMLENDAFSQWLGVELLEIQPGRAKIQMQVRKEMLNGFQIAHGGILFSLADSAFAFAANSHGRISVALDANVSFPTKVLEGDRLIALAEEMKLGGRTGFYDVKIMRGEDGEQVGFFRGTVYRTKNEFFPEED